jgi:dephospho-CoA kinase
METMVIGLTGGIGSGKTTMAKYFASKGIPVYIADDEAKKVMLSPAVIKEIGKAFGEEVLTDGVPDKKKLADVVFNDPEKLQLLNSIIHPKVREHFYEWVQQQKDAVFVIKEAAILFESGSYKDCDKIILVTAPLGVRIKRVMERDNISREKVLERIANQWDDEKKGEMSDYIINNISLEEATKEADKIVKELQKIKIL